MNQTPEQIYEELGRFIIGQNQAKRTMAVALRNRWRKQQLSKVERAAIRPHHVLMAGPSGSGKSECGKQLAKLSNSPFVKAEATQFTEVGYVGREVSEIVEDLVTEAYSMLKANANKGGTEEERPAGFATLDTYSLGRDFEADRQRLVEKMSAYRLRSEHAEKHAEPKIREAYEKLIDLIEFNDSMAALAQAVVKNKLKEFDFPELSDQERGDLMQNLLSNNLLPKLHRRQIYVPKVYMKPFSDGFKREMERFAKGCLGPIVKLGESMPDGPITPEQIDQFREAALQGQQFLTSQKRISLSRLRLLWRSKIIEDEMANIPWPGASDLSDETFDLAKRDFNKSPEAIAQEFISQARDDLANADKRKSEKTDNLATKPPTIANAVKYAEQHGIIFIDEIDKLIGKGTERSDATRAGVQRDLLPLLDGCVVKTSKYGPVDTSNMLFICAGAFQINKPEELMVELQGRLPIRVQLEALGVEDFISILKLKEGNVLDQYASMMRTDGVDLVIEDEAVVAIAKAAFSLNMNQGNYGARRLYACVEHALEDITFLSAPAERIKITITKEYIENHLGKH